MTRRRRVVVAALGMLVAAPAAFVALAAFHLRHVPYGVVDGDRPPAELHGQAEDEGQGGLRLRFLGCTGYEVTDGRTVILLDPTPTRPTLLRMLSGPLAPDDALGARVCPKADFILVNHTHHDHALDVPGIALRTGATVLGSPSTCNLARSRGVPPGSVRIARPGERLRLGTFTVDVRSARHSPVLGRDNPMSGTISAAAGPLWFWQFTQDQTLSFRLEAAGTSVWFHPTSTYLPGELDGAPARTLIVGVSGEPVSTGKLGGILAEARPARVLPTHYDNFFQPLERGLALLPEAGLDEARRIVHEYDPTLPFWVLDLDERVRIPPDDSGPAHAR